MWAKPSSTDLMAFLLQESGGDGGGWRSFWAKDLDKAKRAFLPNQKQRAGFLGFREQTEGTWNLHAVWAAHGEHSSNKCSSSVASTNTTLWCCKTSRGGECWFSKWAVKNTFKRKFKAPLHNLGAMNTLCWVRLTCFGNCGIPGEKQSAAKLQWANKNLKMKPSFHRVRDTEVWNVNHN